MRQLMQKQSDKKEDRRNNRGAPIFGHAPFGPDTVKVRVECECDQEGDDEPAVVQTDLNPADATEFDMRSQAPTPDYWLDA